MKTFYKCTRANGTDFRTGKFDYSKIGAVLEETNADAESKDPCGRGLHVSPTAILTCQFGDRSRDRGKWRWFEVDVASDDVIASDSSKSRVRKLKIVREVNRAEIFGTDFDLRIEEVNEEIKTWSAIPWLKPAGPVPHELIEQLFAEWHEALQPFERNGRSFAKTIRVVTDRKQAERLAADAADAAAADAAAAAAAAALPVFRRYGYWWYVRPYYVLRRWVYWHLARGDGNPWAPLLEMMKIGCAPIGYCKHEDGEVAFTVYVPDVKP